MLVSLLNYVHTNLLEERPGEAIIKVPIIITVLHN